MPTISVDKNALYKALGKEYTREEFDELYGGDTYRAAKQRYDLDSRLLDLYAKAVQRR